MVTQNISHGHSIISSWNIMEPYKHLMDNHETSKISHEISWNFKNISWNIMDPQKYLMEYHGISKISHGLSNNIS